MRMIFVQKFVVEARVQDVFDPGLDFADVDQHAVVGIDLAGENKISDVIATRAVARRGFGTEGGEVFGIRPTGMKRRREAENSSRLLTVSSMGYRPKKSKETRSGCVHLP